ncbi:MAG: DNA repair exonuclease [Candidatus Micrarchaeota archaeon]
MIRFAHMADVHLGAFRHQALRDLNLKAFEQAVDECVKANVAFVIIAGDLFHVALPDMAVVDSAVKKIREAQAKGLSFYVVYGSHDYSPTETSVIDVLCSAGVLKKISNADYGDDGKLHLRVTAEEKTGVKLAGISARTRSLEVDAFKQLDKSELEAVEGEKVFVFHTTIAEMKPAFLSAVEQAIALADLPRGFSYYAGGHVHSRCEQREGGLGLIVYPGPLFAADYRDLEELSQHEAGFYLVTLEKGNAIAEFVPVNVCKVKMLSYDAEGKTPEAFFEDVSIDIEDADVEGAVVLLHVMGTLSRGKPGEINFPKLQEKLMEKSALVVYLNRNALQAPETEALRVSFYNKADAEEKVFRESLSQFKGASEKELQGTEGVALAQALFTALKEPQADEETKKDFENRVSKRGCELLGVKK